MNESSHTYMDTAWLIGEYERTDYHWGWYFIAFFGILTALGALGALGGFVEKWEKRNKFKKMSISEFRHSKYRF